MSYIYQDSRKLSELSLVTELKDSDYIIFERKIGDDCLILETNGNNYILHGDGGKIYLDAGLMIGDKSRKSYRISYQNLKKSFSDYLFNTLSIGTAALHEEWERAKFAHGHNYSDVRFFPSYGPNSGNDDYKDPLCCQTLGSFKIKRYTEGNGSYIQNINVCLPKYRDTIDDLTIGISKYEVGEMCPIAVSNISQYLTGYRGYTIKAYGGKLNIDITLSSFDGFVIPNGTTFTCLADEFLDACLLYTGNPRATSFTVPNIKNFIRFNNNTDTDLDDNEFGFVSHHNGLNSHTHSTAGSGGSMEVVVNGPELKQQKNDAKIHIHTKKWTTHGCYLELSVTSMSMDITGLNSSECTSSNINLDRESYPSHINIPCLLYIGGR